MKNSTFAPLNTKVELKEMTDNIKILIEEGVAEALDKHLKNREVPKLITGLQGLANLLGVSYSTAWRIKSSGVLKDATTQYNRTILFDAEKVLEALHNADQPLVRRRRK